MLRVTKVDEQRAQLQNKRNKEAEMQESRRSEESTKVVETERSAREVDELEADERVFGSDKRNGGNTKKRANK